MAVQRITVFSPPSPETIAAVTRTLGEAGVNGVSMLINRMQEGDAVRLIVDQPEAAIRALEAADYMLAHTEITAVAIDDQPGSVGRFLTLLTQSGIDFDFMNVFPSGKVAGQAVVLIIPNDPAKLTSVLQENDYQELDASDLT